MTKYTEAGIRLRLIDESSKPLDDINKKVKDTFNRIIDESVKAGGKISQINRKIDSEILRETNNFSKTVTDIDKKIKELQSEKDKTIREINAIREKNIKEVEREYDAETRRMPKAQQWSREKEKRGALSKTIEQIDVAAKHDIKYQDLTYTEKLRALREERSRGDRMVQAMEGFSRTTKDKASREFVQDPDKIKQILRDKSPQDLLALQAADKRTRLLQMGMIPEEEAGVGNRLMKYLAGGALVGLAVSQIGKGFSQIYGAGRAPGLTMEEVAMQQERSRGQVKAGAIGGLGNLLMGAASISALAGGPIGWGAAGVLGASGVIANMYSSKIGVEEEQKANFKDYARQKREEFYQARGFYRGVTGGRVLGEMAGARGGGGGIGTTGTTGVGGVEGSDYTRADFVIIPPFPDAGADGGSGKGMMANPNVLISKPTVPFSNIATVADFEKVGISGSQVYQLAGQTVRAYLESNANDSQRAYDVAVQSKAMGLDQGQVLGMAGIRKMFSGDQTSASMINTLKNAGATNPNMSNMMNMYQQLTQTLGQSINKMSVALPASIIRTFGRGEGAWNVNDPRLMGNIQKIQQGLTTPQNDWQKAISFMSLSQSTPGASFWDLTKSQEKGLGTPDALKNLLGTYKQVYGKGDLYKLAIKQRFGFDADTTDTFLQSIESGKIDIAMKMVGAGGKTASASDIAAAEGITSETQKEKAKLDNIVLQGSEEALKQANEIWTQTFKLLNDSAFTYITGYFQNVNDMFSKENKKMNPPK